jgi:hypothetical protein
MCRERLICCLALVLWGAPAAPAADDPQTPIPTAWGKPVKGLQAGIRANPKENIPQAVVALELVVRNVSKEVIEFDHLQLGIKGEHSEGTVTATCVEVYGSFTPKGTRFRAKLAPGESHQLALARISGPEDGGLIVPTPKLRLGENRIGVEGVVVRLAGAKDVELATGYLDVQITPPKK